MSNINEIIKRSKTKLLSSFYKIIKKDNEYKIEEYIGPKQSLRLMINNGWFRLDQFINQINESYPIFNINDFKAIDEKTIVKKSQEDYIKEELLQYLKYLNLSNKLYESLKKLKDLLVALSINTLHYAKFKEVDDLLNIKFNSNLNDGTKYLTLYTAYLNEIYLELEKLNISAPRTFFNEKFNYFFSLIK